MILVPEVALCDRDPRVITREPRKIMCGSCGKRVDDKRLCDHCQSQLPKPDKNYLRITGLRPRQEAGEDVFKSKAEVLAGLKPVVVMLESHSCDIDRQGDISAWGVRPLDQLSRDQQASVRNGENTSLMLVENAGPLPPCAVDFNASFTVPAWCLGEQCEFRSRAKGNAIEKALIPFSEVVAQRLASLSVRGLKRLFEAKVRHLTRLVYELDAPVIEPDDPDRPADSQRSRGWTLPYPKWARVQVGVAAVAGPRRAG